MLIEVYYIEDATVYHVRFKTSDITTSGKVSIPELTGMTELLNTKVGVIVSLGKTIEGEAEAQISGKRV